MFDIILLIFAASAYGYFHGVTLLSKTWETRLIFAKLIYVSLLLNAIMDSVFLCITTVKRENLERFMNFITWESGIKCA